MSRRPVIDEQVWEMRKGNEERVGDWMETVSGIRFFPLDPRPEEVLLIDVAHSLARLNRYNGHIRLEFYSVAEHSTAMAWWFWKQYGDAELALQALHHDDPEGYIGDMVRPLKRNMPEFTALELPVHNACMTAVRLPLILDVRVKEADTRILVDERRQVINPSDNPWGIDHLEPLGVELHGWRPSIAQADYLEAHAFFESRRYA